MDFISSSELKTLQDWFFLRDGDFLPERVCDSKYHHDRNMLQIFKANGALFEKKEDAIQAGNAIRAFLLGNQLSLQSKRQHQSQPGNSQGEAPRKPYSLLEETLTYINKHTQLDCDGREDVKSGSSRTVLIKIFHS